MLDPLMPAVQVPWFRLRVSAQRRSAVAARSPATRWTPRRTSRSVPHRKPAPQPA